MALTTALSTCMRAFFLYCCREMMQEQDIQHAIARQYFDDVFERLIIAFAASSAKKMGMVESAKKSCTWTHLWW